MSRIGRITLQAVFGASLAAALGFGGAQALRASEPEASIERACNAVDCFRYCRAKGAFGECYNGVCYCS